MKQAEYEATEVYITHSVGVSMVCQGVCVGFFFASGFFKQILRTGAKAPL